MARVGDVGQVLLNAKQAYYKPYHSHFVKHFKEIFDTIIF